MSKRQVNVQQRKRIKRKQTSYQQQITTDEGQDLKEGLVIARYSRHALVEHSTNQRIRCATRPGVDSLVAGDRVIWHQENEAQGVVVSCYPRESMLGRPDKRGTIRPVAANITQMMVVIAPQPEISWPLLDSYLIIAEFLNLKACLVLNKVDIPCEPLLQTLYDRYQPLGYAVMTTSASQTKSNQTLLSALNQQVSVFVGQSGVGKSSIISSILPDEQDIATGLLSHNLGRHTTSNSIFYHLPSGGALIDSPGVRAFGLWHMPLDEITKGFREFHPFLTHCKYRNCTHRNTPGCAILNAVQKGIISRARYHNYVKISEQFANKTGMIP